MSALDRTTEAEGDLRCEVIPWTASLWDRVGPVWSELCDATREWSPFLSHAWMAAWVEVFGPSHRPEALVWQDSHGEPVACVLLSMVECRIGPFEVRRAHLNATGEGAVGSEHNDVLALLVHRARVMADLVRRILDRDAEELSLTGFKSDAGAAILAHWPGSPAATVSWSEDPFVDLTALRATGKSYLSALSANTRSQIRRSQRLYTERHGQPTVETAPDCATAVAWLDELAGLHEARWRSEEIPGAFGTDHQRHFHRAVILGAWQGASLAVDLMRVRFGSTTIGLLYNLRRTGAVSFYQSGLAYEEDNRLKPGLVVHALAVQHYLDTGAREYDFLAGEPYATQYKRSLATTSRDLLWCEVAAPTALMRGIAGLRAFKRALRASRRG